MEIKREINNLNVKKTVEKSVAGNEDFHFYVDELTSRNYMPTYAGMADEKYTFDDMDDGFFEFIERKINEDGIYIRLVFAAALESTADEAIFELSFGNTKRTFKTEDLDNVLVFDFADFGIKVKGSEITFGTTVDGGCPHTPYFAEFGSERGSEEYLSLDNPLNQYVLKLMEDLIVLDE